MTERDTKALADALSEWRWLCALRYAGDNMQWISLYFKQVTNHTYILHGSKNAN